MLVNLLHKLSNKISEIIRYMHVIIQVELKHGRISMLAILGHLVTTAGTRLPGNIAYDLPFTSVKSGLAAFDTIPLAGTMQLVSM